MGKILFDTATTINGWIADEQNSLAWLFAVENGTQPDEGLFPAGATVLVEGSTTYKWVLAESDILAHPGKWREFHRDRPTFVFTTRELPVPEGADIRFVTGAVRDALPAIREAAGALDEIAISVAPVALTGGAPLLPRRVESDRLRLESAQKIGQFARLVYRVG